MLTPALRFNDLPDELKKRLGSNDFAEIYMEAQNPRLNSILKTLDNHRERAASLGYPFAATKIAVLMDRIDEYLKEKQDEHTSKQCL